MGYQHFCTKPSEQDSFFWAGQNECKQWYATIKTYKNINISVGYQHFCTKPSEQGSFFQASQNESNQWYAMIDTYKNKYLSTISSLLHETFRTGLVFPSKLKWVQIVVSYDWNLQKHKYLSGISTCFCMKPSEQGSIFWAGQNESK